MFSEHWRSRLFSVWLALVAVLMVLVLPLPARAETPVAQVTLYEVNEALRLKAVHHDDTSELKRRLAQASLLGTDVVAVGPKSVFVTGAFVKADASSAVDLGTGHGPVKGTIQLLTDIDPNRNSLDTLLVTGEIDIRGDLDLTTASVTATAPITGTWRGEYRRERGSYRGVFLIPFNMGGTYYYQNPADVFPGFTCKGAVDDFGPWGKFCRVDSTEFVLGIPLTKALLLFSK